MRKSLELTEQQWSVLDTLAAETTSTAPAGPTYGEPSWRTMVKRIANREITLREVEKMLTESQLKEMISQYLDNGIFTVSEYAETEFAGLTAMMAEDWSQDRLESLRFEYGDFDGLGTFAFEKAKAEGLVPGQDYR